MKRFVVYLAIALLALMPGLAQVASTPASPSPAPSQAQAPAPSQSQAVLGAQLTNPVRPTALSQARARKIYGWDCAMCHGDNGNGKGDVAISDKLQIGDYTDPATLKGMSDGEIFLIIRDGKGKMPSEGDRAKPDEIWNLVIYLRSMAKKPGA
jgi:mono/diheme cytochrome c family protein